MLSVYIILIMLMQIYKQQALGLLARKYLFVTTIVCILITKFLFYEGILLPLKKRQRYIYA